MIINGLRVSEATGADIEAVGIERGHQSLTVTCKGGKVVMIPLAWRTARAIGLAVGERTAGPLLDPGAYRPVDGSSAGAVTRCG